MASVVLTPSAQLPLDPTPTTSVGAPPRKRRRRTAGGGASEDCFACRKRSVKCDRKRPYCTQCIDIGKECSGYKTALTWDVGVASRGKLRGLSCPVANKNVDGSDASPADIKNRRRKTSTSKPKKEERDSDGNLPNLNAIPRVDAVVTSADSSDAFSHAYVTPPLPLTSPQMSNGWHIPGFQDRFQSRQSENRRHLSVDEQTIQHLHTSLGPQYDSVSMPHSGRSYSSYADADTEFHSPMEYPHTPVSLPFPEQLPQPMSLPFQHQSTTANSADASSIDSYQASINSEMDVLAQGALANGTALHTNQYQLDVFDNGLFNRLAAYVGPVSNGQLSLNQTNVHDEQVKEEDYNDDRTGLSLLDARFASPFFSMSPRLQTLMEYYSRNICPYLVAFDGPENPYRKHILQLALDNEGLQNAIAALSTNNFRMRKKQPRQIGFVEEITNAFNSDRWTDWNEPTAEELCYKELSIQQLNMQLHNKHAAEDDSVLAMLLILCLFHVCDSGFSQFQTQLAGVQKLMSFRRPNTQSDFTRWVQMFFIWFDVMTSAVNDRETQIDGASLAMLDFSANLGALEQYSGCDGRLFKLIARLGRLNVLAQGKPVKLQGGPRRKRQPVHSMQFTKGMKPTMRFPVNKSLHPEDYENIDGNGWGTPIISSDDDADGSADEGAGGRDNRQDFWMEWHDIRTRLLEWHMDMPRITTPGSPNAPTDPAQLDAGQRDLIHINESFRFSALLYTERLGHPLLPSSHHQFQNLVSQVLYHITALPVTSCVNKFLMWPLFIAGTECVDEAHRDFIRRRCRDLTEESGFFNNISSLWVLEKVWKEVGNNVRGSEAEEVRARRRDSEASRSGRYGQAFRWRKAMDRADGEYIVL